MKHILLLGTGGTIACKHGDSGLTPLLTGDELLSYVPAARSFCEVEAIQVLNIDSTNIHPKHWQLLCQVLGDQTKAVFLGHLSKENNYEELAYATVKLEIDLGDTDYHADDFRIEVASREKLSPVIAF